MSAKDDGRDEGWVRIERIGPVAVDSRSSAADGVGLEHVLTVLNKLRREHGDRYWTAAPLLERLERSGRGFADWS